MTNKMKRTTFFFMAMCVAFTVFQLHSSAAYSNSTENSFQIPVTLQDVWGRPLPDASFTVPSHIGARRVAISVPEVVRAEIPLMRAGGSSITHYYRLVEPTTSTIIIDNVTSETNPVFTFARITQPVRNIPRQPDRVPAQIVAPNPDGTLTYASWNTHDNTTRIGNPGRTLTGNTMPDFSRVGFREGLEEIPFLTEENSFVIRLEPNPTGDDTERIHAAIAKIGSQPVREHGFRGVVELAPGIFRISGEEGIQLNRSGVVLRGSGQGPDGTVIHYLHRPGVTAITHDWRNMAVGITVGTTDWRQTVQLSHQTAVVPGWYPVGTRRITLENADAFSAGDRIGLRRVPTLDWVNFMNMTMAAQWGFPTTDIPAEGAVPARNYALNFEHIIERIDGNHVYLQTPLVQGLHIPIDDEAFVSLINDETRVVNVGVENLRIKAMRESIETNDFNRGRTAIRIIGARDAFVRDITSVYFIFGAVNVYYNAANISVLNSSYLRPEVTYASARLYAFCVDGNPAIGNFSTQILFAGNYAQEARYEFVTGPAVGGPVVFIDGVGEQSRRGPQTHHRWAVGVLFDNIRMIDGGRFRIENRGAMGSGHGWAGANSVIWNVISEDILVARPPTAQNFIVGTGGILPNGHNFRAQGVESRDSTPEHEALVAAIREFHGDAHIENIRYTVEPISLYRAQVAYNQTGAYWNTAPNRPFLLRPMPDTTVEPNVAISGIHDKFASQVTIYINGRPIEAPLGNAANDFMFSLTANLTPGYHTIAATQTVNGIVSPLTAQRSVNVRNADGSYNNTPSGFVFNETNAARQNVVARQIPLR